MVEELIGEKYYHGFYEKGLWTGEGVLITNEYIYEGNFVKGKFEGEGKKIYLKMNKILEGEFFLDVYQGRKITYNNYYYEGDIKNDKANGIGWLHFQNDWIFEGIFFEDEIFEN